MPRAQVPNAQVHRILKPFTQRQRLTTLIRTMALEIERLDEDNTQLRAAVAIYRDALRRYGYKDSRPSTCRA